MHNRQFNFDSLSETDISYAYLSACDTSVTAMNFSYVALLETDDIPISSISQIHALHIVPTTDTSTRIYTSRDIANPLPMQVSTFKARKVHPILAKLPDKFCIIHNIIGDPLKEWPTYSPNPPPFEPTGRYIEERRDIIESKLQSDSNKNIL